MLLKKFSYLILETLRLLDLIMSEFVNKLFLENLSLSDNLKLKSMFKKDDLDIFETEYLKTNYFVTQKKIKHLHCTDGKKLIKQKLK